MGIISGIITAAVEGVIEKTALYTAGAALSGAVGLMDSKEHKKREKALRSSSKALSHSFLMSISDSIGIKSERTYIVLSDAGYKYDIIRSINGIAVRLDNECCFNIINNYGKTSSDKVYIVKSRNSEVGRIFIRNNVPTRYLANDQTWDVIISNKEYLIAHNGNVVGSMRTEKRLRDYSIKVEHDGSNNMPILFLMISLMCGVDSKNT